MNLPRLQDRPFWSILLLFFSLLFFLTPQVSFEDDMLFWVHWSQFMFEYGVGGIYNYKIGNELPTNYHPFFLHCLYYFGKFQGSIADIHENLRYVKIIPLVFDFIGALSIFLLVKKEDRNWWLPFLLLFNIAYLYNSYVWGQIDSIFTTFSLLAIVFAIRKSPGAAIVFYLLALNTKLQAIIFLPLFLLLLIPLLFHKKKASLIGLGIAILIQIVLLWPFYYAATLREMIQVLSVGSVDLYPRTSINAFNFWYFFFGADSMFTEDSELYLGRSYKSWGLILFFIGSTLSLLPVLLRVLRKWLDEKALSFFEDHRSMELIFLSATLVTLCFFFFNTQMHERYSHPAVVMSFFYAYYRKNYLLYILVSLFYLLNMEWVLKAFKWDYDLFIFEPVNIAWGFAVIILIGLIALFSRHWGQGDFRYLAGKIFSSKDSKE